MIHVTHVEQIEILPDAGAATPQTPETRPPGGNRGLTSKCLGPARAGPNASRVGPLVLSRAGARLGFGRHLVVARRLGKHVVNLGDGACLIHALNRRNLPGHSV
jgi:hypothetical protein